MAEKDADDSARAAMDHATKMVINELKALYKQKLLPLEQTFKYDRFCAPFMTDSEFEAKPMVLLIGQYSTGKTTFIRYLIGKDFPNQRIGPEPTTDRFTAVIGGENDRVVPGNALCVSADLPFRGLEKFGTGFLNHFEGSQCDSKVLEHITLVDSPGILAGRKQGERGYDFKEICQWFSERCDLILLLFDAHKLDVSDELLGTLERLKGQEDKIRCVLNKADQIDRQRLMRVYGALMWAMGKVLDTPEVLRVYIGSFWDEPLVHEELANLFEHEENDLMRDLRDLPRNSAVRKINELVKRARLAKVNAHLVGYLKAQMPVVMGQRKKQDALLGDLPGVFRTVMKQSGLSPGDFPDLNEFRAKLSEEDFAKFAKFNKKQLDGVEELLSVDIPRLMERLPKNLFAREALPTEASGYGQGSLRLEAAEAAAAAEDGDKDEAEEAEEEAPPPPPKPNPFAKPPPPPAAPSPKPNPFAKPVPWAPRALLVETDAAFEALGGQGGGTLSGDAVRPALVERVGEAHADDLDTLFRVWELSDHDGDGELTSEEFALAMYLCDLVKDGSSDALPSEEDGLPEDLVPPSQR